MFIGGSGGRKFIHKKKQQVAYASLATAVYHTSRLRNHALWEAAVLRPEMVIKNIQVDVCIKV